jgi:predicted enzyme related to lactoylglutathione lyase
METILGIGGIFFKVRDPTKLAVWYREHLGVPVEMNQSCATLVSSAPGEPTVWSTFAQSSDYFGPGDARLMINYRVRDLDAILVQLRAAGVPVLDHIEDSEFGRFGWATDPEGNRFELWQAPSDEGQRLTPS